MISQLSDRQEEARAIIEAARNETDRTTMDGLIGNLGYSDDLVIAVTLARFELSKDIHRDLTQADLAIAGGLLDNLDTLGYVVVKK